VVADDESNCRDGKKDGEKVKKCYDKKTVPVEPKTCGDEVMMIAEGTSGDPIEPEVRTVEGVNDQECGPALKGQKKLKGGGGKNSPVSECKVGPVGKSLFNKLWGKGAKGRKD